MSHPHMTIKDAFENQNKALICENPEECEHEYHEHIEHEDIGETHLYGCECGDCMYFYWSMKN